MIKSNKKSWKSVGPGQVTMLDKMLGQTKEIKPNSKSLEIIDIYFYLNFAIFLQKTRKEATSPANFDIFLAFSNVLRCLPLKLFGYLWGSKYTEFLLLFIQVCFAWGKSNLYKNFYRCSKYCNQHCLDIFLFPSTSLIIIRFSKSSPILATKRNLY